MIPYVNAATTTQSTGAAAGSRTVAVEDASGTGGADVAAGGPGVTADVPPSGGSGCHPPGGGLPTRSARATESIRGPTGPDSSGGVGAGSDAGAAATSAIGTVTRTHPGINVNGTASRALVATAAIPIHARRAGCLVTIRASRPPSRTTPPASIARTGQSPTAPQRAVMTHPPGGGRRGPGR